MELKDTDAGFDVREKAEAVRSCLEEYRLSVYLYAYSSFLEIMLYGNFEEEYLEAVVRKIEDRSMKASEGFGSFSRDIKKDMMVKLTDARNSDVRPFVENIESVNRLYNEPVMLMADDEVIYVLPAEASEQVPTPHSRTARSWEPCNATAPKRTTEKREPRLSYLQRRQNESRGSPPSASTRASLAGTTKDQVNVNWSP